MLHFAEKKIDRGEEFCKTKRKSHQKRKRKEPQTHANDIVLDKWESHVENLSAEYIYCVISFCSCSLISAESMSGLAFGSPAAPPRPPDGFGVEIGRAHTFLCANQ